MSGDNAHVLDNVAIVEGHDHVLTAQNVGGTHQDGEANLVGGGQSLLLGVDGAAGCAGNTAALQQSVKALAVLGFVDGVGGGAQNVQADVFHVLGQLDGGLTAKLHHAGVRLFGGDDIVHAFRSQRVKVQAVAGVKVGGDGFGVVVDDNSLAAVLLQGPNTMDRAVVELDALTDADGAGTKDQNLLLFAFGGFLALDKGGSLVVLVVGGVEVGGAGGKLGGAGINHLVAGVQLLGQNLHLSQTLDGLIHKAHLLGGTVQLGAQHAVAAAQLQLHVGQILQLILEPPVNLGDVVDHVVGDTALQRLVHAEHTLGVLHMQMLHDFLVGVAFEILQSQGLHAQLDGGNGLHDGQLEAVADGHHLAGGHHLGAQTLIGVDELIEGPLGVLDHDVVNGGLEAGGGGAGHVVANLVQSVADGDFAGHLGDGVTGGLGGQSGRTGHTGVDLDDRVLEAVGLERELAVAAALDAQLVDDIQSGGAQHLVFLIGQSLAGSHNDGVAGVDTNGVHVFHAADGNGVALTVAHDLELDFLPTGDALFHKDLVDGGKTQAVGADFDQLFAVLADAAAGAAHGKGGTHDDGVADFVGGAQGVFQGLNNLTGDGGLVQLLHGSLEQLAVLGAVDGLLLTGQQTDAGLFQVAGAGQLHGDVQAVLAAHVGDDGVRLFDLQNPLDHVDGHGLDVHMIGDFGVGHDGGGVGVQQHGLDALGLQRAASLGAGVVELGSLTDDDGAGTDNQYLLNAHVSGHISSPPLLRLPAPQSGRTGTRSPWGRRWPRG